MLAQLVKQEGQGPRRGVATCKEYSDDLITDDLAVAGRIGEGMQEGLVFGIFEGARVER